MERYSKGEKSAIMKHTHIDQSMLDNERRTIGLWLSSQLCAQKAKRNHHLSQKDASIDIRTLPTSSTSATTSTTSTTTSSHSSSAPSVQTAVDTTFTGPLFCINCKNVKFKNFDGFHQHYRSVHSFLKPFQCTYTDCGFAGTLLEDTDRHFIKFHMSNDLPFMRKSYLKTDKLALAQEEEEIKQILMGVEVKATDFSASAAPSVDFQTTNAPNSIGNDNSNNNSSKKGNKSTLSATFLTENDVIEKVEQRTLLSDSEQVYKEEETDFELNEVEKEEESYETLLARYERLLLQYPYECRIDPNCQLGFTKDADRLVHEREHIGVKPFQCTWPVKNYDGNINTEICGQHFLREQFTRDHIKAEHYIELEGDAKDDDLYIDQYIFVDQELLTA